MDLKELFNYLMDLVTSVGIKLLAAIVVLVVGIFLIKRLVKWLKSSPKLNKFDQGLRSFLSSFANIGLYVVLVITIATILGIPMTSFITILASAGVAIGLALQGALSNFAGGLMLLLFKPFKIGDYVDVAGESGVVTEITVVYTVITTLDNKRITIPNGTITASVVKNYSYEKLRRVDIDFNTSYKDDIEKVKALVLKIATAHPLALKDPAPFVRLSKHNDSSLTYTLRVWCENQNYWDLNFDLVEGIKKAFDENDISIPYNQLDVHVTND